MKKEKEVLYILVFLILFLGVLLVGSVQESEDKISEDVYRSLRENKEARVIVELREDSEKQKIKKEIMQEIKKEAIKHVFDDSIAVEISKRELKQLNENPNIKSIIIDKPISAFLQDSVLLINASTVWNIQISNTNITGIDETICILDTGINFSHSDLIGRNKSCVIDCVDKACVKNCSIGDDNGHGTHVAGIVAARGNLNGVAVGASLVGVKVLDSVGSGSTSDLNAGIDWCIANSDTHNISVISMSLGTHCINNPEYCYNSYCDSSESSTATRINNATFYNISVIAATGNNGNTTHISSPACIKNATAVGASDKSNNVASYSNRNSLVDLFAPGSNINSSLGTCLSDCSCSGNYMVCSGTSMAAPHISGAFALFRQFFKLQNNRVPTPSEIQITLNSSGVKISDSGSGLNFSRIDIYSALISIDNLNPSVNLISPFNNTKQFSQNVSFACSANDVQLSNLTLYVWNSSGIYNNSETEQLTGVNKKKDFNRTLDYGIYKWNCLAYDNNRNFSYANSNFTLIVGEVGVSLDSPANDSFTNQNQSFNCSYETEAKKRFMNVSFFLWNATNNLIYNFYENASGTANSTIFQYNLTQEGAYSWNCQAYNNNSEYAFANNNYTITYDITSPGISLISPADSSSYISNSQSITFRYNVSDNYNIANCRLIINNVASLTNSSINKSLNQSFTQSFSSGDYNWTINCSDNAGNIHNSNQRNFTVTAPIVETSSGGGGGGGGSGASFKTYSLTNEEISKGYTKELNKNDKVKFSFFDEKAEEHLLTVSDIGENFVNLTIKSETINLLLGIGQSVKLNLTSPDYYDLYIKLNLVEVISRKLTAKLTIQTIHDEIPKQPSITGSVVEDGEKIDEEKEKKSELKSEVENLRKTVYLLMLLLITIIIFLLFREKKYTRENILKAKNLKEYREMFKKSVKPKR